MATRQIHVSPSSSECSIKGVSNRLGNRCGQYYCIVARATRFKHNKSHYLGIQYLYLPFPVSRFASRLLLGESSPQARFQACHKGGLAQRTAGPLARLDRPVINLVQVTRQETRPILDAVEQRARRRHRLTCRPGGARALDHGHCLGRSTSLALTGFSST